MDELNISSEGTRTSVYSAMEWAIATEPTPPRAIVVPFGDRGQLVLVRKILFPDRPAVRQYVSIGELPTNEGVEW